MFGKDGKQKSKEIVAKCSQEGVLSELYAHVVNQSKTLEKHAESLDDLVKQGVKNTSNLEHHIRRTDLLQDLAEKVYARQNRILLLMAFISGTLAVKYGPGLMKYIMALI